MWLRGVGRLDTRRGSVKIAAASIAALLLLVGASGCTEEQQT